MKKYSLFVGIIAVASIFHSCKKNDDQSARPDSPAAGTLVSSPQKRPELVSFKTEQGTVTMLKFASWQDFDATAAYLQALVNAAEEDFNTQYANLSDDELNKVAEETGFDKQQPLIDIERRYGFDNTYRKTHNRLKEEWLNHADLDMANNPSLKTMFYGAEQSLINGKQQVMVDNVIYQCRENGYYFIKSDYETNLSIIENGAFGTSEQPSQTMGFFDWVANLVTGSTGSGSSGGVSDVGCATWKKEGKDDENVTGDKKVYYYTGIRSISLYCKSLAGVESYYKKGNKWKGYKTRLTVFMTAALRDLYCGDAGPTVTEWEDKKSDDLLAHETSWGGGEGGTAFRAKNGLSIYGNYTYYGLNQAAVLSW